MARTRRVRTTRSRPASTQDVDVVGDGALRAVQGGRQVGHGRRPLEQQIDDRDAELVGKGPQLRRGRDVQPVRETRSPGTRY